MEYRSGLVGLRKQAALILMIITIVALAVTMNSGRVYAAPVLTITPNPVTQGTDVQISGSGFQTSVNGFYWVWDTASCSNTIILSGAIQSDASGNFGPVTIHTTGLSVGIHCVQIVSLSTPDTFSSLTVNPAVIPEYPLGLPLLAVFLVIGYGLIRRKTSATTN